MSLTFNNYINAVKSNSRTPTIKLEFLDFNENVISVITPDLISGDLSLNAGSGARRNCNFILENTKGIYIPEPEGNLWINTKLRLWTGLKINNEDYFVSRGIFVIGEPQISSLRAEKTASLSFYDKWCLLDGTLGGTIESDYIIPVGTNIETAVRSLFQDAGDIKMPIIYPTSETTPYTITKEAGSTFADILIELAQMLSYEVFYDRNGYGRFEPPTDINSSASVWDFNTNEVLYLGSTHKYEFSKIRNFVKVIGDNINGQIFSAVAQDDNINSPTRVSLIGKRVKVINDDLIYSTDLAQQRANYELRNEIALMENVDLKSIPIDTIEAGSIITINDSSNGLNGDRFLVNSVTFSLIYSGEMSLGVWKTRNFT